MRDTIDMAREAGFPMAWISDNDGGVIRWKDIKAFAELVRADEREQSLRREKLIAERWAIECASQVKIEREACAKVCDDLLVPAHISLDDESLWEAATLDCAEAIRARSQS
jgi:hypothetical protein